MRHKNMLDCIYSNTSFPYKKIGSVKEESISDMKMEYFSFSIEHQYSKFTLSYKKFKYSSKYFR